MCLRILSRKMRDVGDSIDDASVTALVKMILFYHRSISAFAFDTKVVTNNGQVTLEGLAVNAAQKDLATKYVQDVYGVNSVVNNMTIRPVTFKRSKSKQKVEGC